MNEKDLKLGENLTEESSQDSEKEQNWKELYAGLRNQINQSVEGFRKSLSQTKDAIEQEEQKLELLKKRRERLEGAIEAGSLFLKSSLPSNNKKNA